MDAKAFKGVTYRHVFDHLDNNLTVVAVANFQAREHNSLIFDTFLHVFGAEVWLNCQATRKKSYTICISSLEQAIGTYTFDTASKKWSQATHWALPFFGRAEHVPELGLWFGVEHANRNPDHCLRAFDLSSSPPVVRKTWSYLERLADVAEAPA